MPVVLSECETWCLTVRNEHRQGVFAIQVLRRIFGPKKEEVAKLKKFHDEELHNLYSSNMIRMTQLRKIKWTGHVACMAEKFIQGFCREI